MPVLKRVATTHVYVDVGVSHVTKRTGVVGTWVGAHHVVLGGAVSSVPVGPWSDGVAQQAEVLATFAASQLHVMNQKWRNIWIRDVFCAQHLWCRGQTTSRIQHKEV